MISSYFPQGQALPCGPPLRTEGGGWEPTARPMVQLPAGRTRGLSGRYKLSPGSPCWWPHAILLPAPLSLLQTPGQETATVSDVVCQGRIWIKPRRVSLVQQLAGWTGNVVGFCALTSSTVWLSMSLCLNPRQKALQDSRFYLLSI